MMLGGFARGPLMRHNPDQIAMHAASNAIIRLGRGFTNPACRNLFTESLIHNGSPAQKASFDELQRVATSPDNATGIMQMNGAIDVSDLARQVKVPVLVMHCQGDKRVPLEEGRRMAALIPGARFMSLPGNNHIVLPDSPAAEIFFPAFHRFVDAHAPATPEEVYPGQ